MAELFDPRAFALGMLALLNPCGFALLPAYLGVFLGLDDNDEKRSTLIALNRAQVVGLSMSAGFLAVFGLLGLFFAQTITTLNTSGWLPRITVVMGVGLVALGIAMAFGFQPLLKLPKLNKGGSSGSIGSMFLFGVSYAVASLTCTIGLLLSAIGTSAGGSSFTERFGAFISYAIGMGLLATVLTLAVGFGKKGLVNSFRKVLPVMNVISAVVLVVVGSYVALYGIWSEQVLDFTREPTPWIDSIVIPVENTQGAVTQWMNSTVNPFGILEKARPRTTFLGWGFLGINVTLAIAGFFARISRTGSNVSGMSADNLDAPAEITTSDVADTEDAMPFRLDQNLPEVPVGERQH